MQWWFTSVFYKFYESEITPIFWEGRNQASDILISFPTRFKWNVQKWNSGLFHFYNMAFSIFPGFTSSSWIPLGIEFPESFIFQFLIFKKFYSETCWHVSCTMTFRIWPDLGFGQSWLLWPIGTVVAVLRSHEALQEENLGRRILLSQGNC